MKVKELIKKLETYNSEAEVFITLPPGWFKEDEDKNIDLWEKDGWTLDSVDYVIVPTNADGSDNDSFICFCPLKCPDADNGFLKTKESVELSNEDCSDALMVDPISVKI